MSALFTPYRLGSLELRNRIVIAPMCQYSADDGRATDWHLIHLGNLALSGAGLLIIEATAVLPEGRISPDDLGLWSAETENALGRVVETVRRYSDMPIAIQLAHAGRKASTHTPWKGSGQIRPGEDRGWQTVAPSAIPFAEGENPPVALDHGGLAAVRDAFVEAARRSARLGFDAIQLHGAHGYSTHHSSRPIGCLTWRRQNSKRRAAFEGSRRDPRLGFRCTGLDPGDAARGKAAQIQGAVWASRDAFREGAIARNFNGLKLFGVQSAVEYSEDYGYCEWCAEPLSFLHVIQSILSAL